MGNRDIQREERAIYLVAIVSLLPVVIVALVESVDFDAGTTLCLAAVVLAALGFATTVRRERQRLPRARVRSARVR